MIGKILKVGYLCAALPLIGCNQKEPQPAAKVQPITSNYSLLQEEVTALADVGITSEKVGRFNIVSFDAGAFNTKQSELMARIRADSTLTGTGTDSSGQKGELLFKCTQAFAIAQAQPMKSKEEVRNFILAYAGNAVSDSDVQHTVIKLWGADALKELMKANNSTIGEVVKRVLT